VQHQCRFLETQCIRNTVKVKLWTLAAALYNIQSGSWLAWANDTTVHDATINCPH